MQYISLYLSYGVVALLIVILHQYKLLWEPGTEPKFKQPWKEFIYVLIAGICIIVIGQVYMAGLLFPHKGIWFESLNQLTIFSPALILLFIRHKNLRSAWISPKDGHLKIGTGIILGFTAIFIYSQVGSSKPFLFILGDTISVKNIPFLVQVLMEDIVIAMLLIRLKQATSLSISLIAVSLIFAAGHIPAMIGDGIPIEELYSLFLDAGLGVFLCYTLYKTKDILWFWIVHYSMDMMQFYS